MKKVIFYPNKHTLYLEDHIHYLISVFEVLRKEKLYAKPQKCEFCTEKVIFLGFVVSSKGIKMDAEKARAAKDDQFPLQQMRYVNSMV